MSRSVVYRLLSASVWLYLFAVVAVGIVLRTGGERWWWATVMLFAPRWIWAAPLAVLGPAALATWGLGAGRNAKCKMQNANCKMTSPHPSPLPEGEGTGGREQGSAEEKAEGRRQKAENAEGNANCKLQNAKCKLAEENAASTEGAILHSPGCNPGEENANCKMQIANCKMTAVVPVVLAAVWVAWPLMGVCISWNGVVGLVQGSQVRKDNTASTEGAILDSPGRNPGEDEGARERRSDGESAPLTLRVLTCNVGLEGYDEAALARLVEETQPDVVTLQEGYGEGSGFRVQGSEEGSGFRVQGSGEEKAVSTEGAILDSPGYNPGEPVVSGEWRVDGIGSVGNALRGVPRAEGHGQETGPNGADNPKSKIQNPKSPDGLGRPSSDPQPPTWHVSAAPGIMLASRFPIVSQQTLQREDKYGPRTVGVAYQLDTGKGAIAFVALHLYTPRDGLMSTPTRPWEGNPELEENTAWRAQESADAARWIAGLPGPVIVAGDMNLTPDSEVFRRDWSRYTDAFTAAGFGYGYTYGYDASRPLWGIRIDHVLADSGWRVERCWVGPHIHSDHRPLLADLRQVDGRQ